MLDGLPDEDLFWLASGYVSGECYRVTKTETPERTVTSLDLERLATPYVKRWDAPSAWLLNHYRELPAEGFSVGALGAV